MFVYVYIYIYIYIHTHTLQQTNTQIHTLKAQVQNTKCINFVETTPSGTEVCVGCISECVHAVSGLEVTGLEVTGLEATGLEVTWLEVTWLESE